MDALEENGQTGKDLLLSINGISEGLCSILEEYGYYGPDDIYFENEHERFVHLLDINPGKVQALRYNVNKWANEVTSGTVEIVVEEPTEAEIAEAELFDADTFASRRQQTTVKRRIHRTPLTYRWLL